MLALALTISFVICTDTSAVERCKDQKRNSQNLAVDKSVQVEQTPASNISTLPQPQSEYELDYGDTVGDVTSIPVEDGRAVILIAKAKLTSALQKTLMSETQDAYRLIEPLGKNEKPVVICVVSKITPKFQTRQNDIKFSGLTFTHDAKLHIAMRDDCLRFDYLAHELCHLRLTELGLQYSWWIDEGIAECFESWDYISQDHLETLKKGQVATLAELNGYKPLQGEELKLRATAWAICYHLIVQKKIAFSDLEHTASNIDPKVVVLEVLRKLSK
jgi:hypothetical protein